MKYSAKTNGFYGDALVYPSVPDDLVEISDAEYSALLRGQSQGQLIVSGPDGSPLLQDAPALTSEELALAARQRRDALLAASDWTQLPDAPEGSALQWKPYRAALREVPGQAGFPTEIDWPAVPA